MRSSQQLVLVMLAAGVMVFSALFGAFAANASPSFSATPSGLQPALYSGPTITASVGTSNNAGGNLAITEGDYIYVILWGDTVDDTVPINSGPSISFVELHAEEQTTSDYYMEDYIATAPATTTVTIYPDCTSETCGMWAFDIAGSTGPVSAAFNYEQGTDAGASQTISTSTSVGANTLGLATWGVWFDLDAVMSAGTGTIYGTTQYFSTNYGVLNGVYDELTTSGVDTETVDISPNNVYGDIMFIENFGSAAAPLAPTGTSATTVSTSQIDLAWTNPAGSLTDNHVYTYAGPSCSGGPLSSTNIGSVVTSYDATSLTSTANYSFEVTASNAAGEGSPSACFGNATWFGYDTKVYHLIGLAPLSAYLNNGIIGGATYDTQMPTLTSDIGQPSGIYYVDNSSDFDVMYLSNSTVRHIASVTPLYQLWGYTSMLDNEFFVEYDYNMVLFFGTLTSSGTTYSIELLNVATGTVLMWNTGWHVDATNQEPVYVGNNTVIVMSSNDSIEAFNLQSHENWHAGTLDWFEANNIYWVPQLGQLINVQSDGSSGGHISQYTASYPSGEIAFTFSNSIAAIAGVNVNSAEGIGLNTTNKQIAVSDDGYSLTIDYAGAGNLLTTSGMRTYQWQDHATAVSAQSIGGQRYVYTGTYVIGNVFDGTQYIYDPWNGTTYGTNVSFYSLPYTNYPCANYCFEGTYAPSANYAIAYAATVNEFGVGGPFYHVVYAYHNPSRPYPGMTIPPHITVISNIHATSAEVFWSQGVFDDSSTVTNNTILVGTSCGTWTFMVSTHGAATSGTVSGLTPLTNYCAAVEMWNASGGSSIGPSSMFTTTGNSPPEITDITAISQTAADIFWTEASFADSSEVVNYTMLLGTTCGTWTIRASEGFVLDSSTPTLVADTTYCVAIQAWNATGSITGGTQTFMTLNYYVPSAPTGVDAVTVSYSTIDVNWTNPVSTPPVTDEVISIYAGAVCAGHPLFTYDEGGVTEGPQPVVGLTSDTTYSFTVDVVNNVGPSPQSSCASNTTFVEPPQPTLTISQTTFYSFDESWTNGSWTNVTGTYLTFTTNSTRCNGGYVDDAWNWASYVNGTFVLVTNVSYIPQSGGFVDYEYNTTFDQNFSFLSDSTVWVGLVVETTSGAVIIGCQSVTFTSLVFPVGEVVPWPIIAFGVILSLSMVYFAIYWAKNKQKWGGWVR